MRVYSLEMGFGGFGGGWYISENKFLLDRNNFLRSKKESCFNDIKFLCCQNNYLLSRNNFLCGKNNLLLNINNFLRSEKVFLLDKKGLYW